MIAVKRFDVWLVDLNPTKGKEMSALSTVLMAPMTTKGFELPGRVKCKFKGKTGLILLDQIRAVDKSRLVKKLGKVTEKTQIELCLNLQEMFEF